MHIVENKSRSQKGKKIYNSILLRESYRENGKVKKRTIANLSRCAPEEIAAIKLALKHKDDLGALGSLKDSVELQEGLSVGGAWTVYQVAKDLGIEKSLGNEFPGKLALWQIIAQVIDHGSRLLAVRLAQAHALADVLQIERGFDENDLYANLKWLTKNQDRIESNLFSSRRGKNIPKLFFYDVTSSYLEGQCNFFVEYGYNRDGKKGKKQIVIGLLCDEFGDPVSTEVFAGNTQDPKTFSSQVSKVAGRFGCKDVTFVGDRGLKKESLLDGCYAIKTDLPQEVADKQSVHDRYKDLAMVEKAFRDCKTVNLEARPVFVRTEQSTRGHILVVMLAYMIIRKLRQAWENLGLTVEEGLKQLSTLCAMEVKVKDHGSCLKIPKPRKNSEQLGSAKN